MPLHDFPVIMPYRLSSATDESLYSLQIHTVVSTEAAAIATAKVLASAVASLRHPQQAFELMADRAKIGSSGRQIEGPYAYVLTKGNHLFHLDFPARIDTQAGDIMGNSFAGLDPTSLLGVVMDCHSLAYINTSGLANLAAHAKRIHLQLFRVSEPVRRVFEIVGLLHLINIHPTMQLALEQLSYDQNTTTNNAQ